MKIFKNLTTLILAFSVTGLAAVAQKNVQKRDLAGIAGEKNNIEKNISNCDLSPNKNVQLLTTGSKAMWDIVLNADVAGIAEAGIETDGNYIYTSKWSGAMFYRYTMAGAIVDSFSVPTVTGIRDLAFDGTYFYGGTNAATIYKMDFTNYTLIGTIACPAGTTVRNIAYDSDLVGFWVGGWDTDIKCVSPTGTVLQTIPAANHALTGMYGSAYDNKSPGGPYLWIFDQGAAGDGAFFNQIKISTGLLTGVTHDCSDISTTAMAGGAFCFKHPNGKVILGGNAQGEKIFAYELINSAGHCDISPALLLAPLSSDLLTTTNAIQVRVINNDTVDHFDIPISYEIDGSVAVNDTITDTIVGGSFIDFTFLQTHDFSIPGHIYSIEIYTAFACDTINSNDTLETYVSNLWDVSPVSFNEPPIIAVGTPSLKATVSNLGTIAATFNVTMQIQGGFTSTKTVTNLAPAASQQVTFDPWTAVLGTYAIKIFTTLAADSVHSNDTLNTSVQVMELDKVYCYVAYDELATLNEGPAITSLQVPGVITKLADQTGQNYVTGATCINKLWYASVGTDNTLITIDTITGARTVIGTIGLQITGLAYNYFNSTLYAMEYDGAKSNLHTINLTTGAPTLIGVCNSKLLINLACSKTGVLYSLAIDDDNMYRIDASTGVATLVGPVGFDASYSQDMEFDHKTDVLYMAAYNVTSGLGELRTVNTLTGATTLVGAFQNGAEITGMAIPGTPTYNSVDAGSQSITAPITSSTLTANEHISVLVANYGSTDITSGLSVSYILDGAAPVTEAISTTIPAGTAITHTFAPAVDFSVAGSIHSIKSYTTYAGDQDNTNDTTSTTVQNTYGVYCIAGGGCDEHISNVVFGTISNATQCSAGGYADYTSTNTNLGLAQTLTLTVTNGTPYSADECGVWIDWNENGDFSDANEAITVSGTPGNGPYTASVSVPAATSLGDKRMRIRITYDMTPLPCGVDTYGEVEDYTVKVVDDASVSENATNTVISVYPNPAGDKLNITSSEKINRIKIYNPFGQLVYDNLIGNTNFTINTSNFAEGFYYLNIETLSGISTEKITIKK